MTKSELNWSYKHLWWGLGLLYLLLLAYSCLTSDLPIENPDIPYIDKFYHFLGYFLPAFGFAQLLQSSVKTTLYLTFYGIILEILQKLGGHRMFEFSDMAFNTFGSLMGSYISLKLNSNWLLKLDRWIFLKKKKSNPM